MPGHIVPKKLYILVFAALIVLTGLTTGVAFINLGKWNTVAALAIAVCKASLVVLFFMHLRWGSNLLRIVVVSSLLWLAILISLTTTDFFSRDWTPIPEGWEESSLVRPPIPPGNLISQVLKPSLHRYLSALGVPPRASSS